MSGVRLAVRLARREMRRGPWRTALVLLMVLVPTAAMTAATTFVRTSERSPELRRAAEAGQADVTGYWVSVSEVPSAGSAQPGAGMSPVFPSPPVVPASAPIALPPPPSPPQPPLRPGGAGVQVTAEAVAALRAALPAGSSVLVERRAQDRWRDGARRSYFTLSDVDLADPIVAGRFRHLRGRAPAAATEAVVSDDLARRLGLAIGDRFRPERLGRELTVVGTVVAMEGPDLVVTTGPFSGSGQQAYAWVDLPGRPYADVTEDRQDAAAAGLPSVAGWSLSPAVLTVSDTKDEEVFWTYVGGVVALAVLGTVIAAAFAVAARRQLRTLGLLSSAGASPRMLRGILAAQGATLGVAGSVLGVAAGLAAAAAVPDRLLRWLAGGHADGLVVRPADVVPIVLIGVVAAAVAAWLPARSISTVPTLAALAGRRPLGAVPVRLPVLGATSIGAGCALFAMAVAGTRDGGSTPWALVAITGALACLFGALAVCPWVVAALERLAGRWPESWRLAARSLARSRVRSSAVVGAVVAVSASLVAGTTLYASFRDDSDDRVPWVAANQVRIERMLFDPSTALAQQNAAVPHEVVDRTRQLVPAAAPVEVLQVGTASAGGSFAPALASFAGGASRSAGPQFYEQHPVALATPELLDLFQVPSDRRAALERGESVLVAGDGDGVSALLVARDGDLAGQPVRIPVAEPFRSPQAARSLPQVLISEETAREHGLAWQPSPVVTLIAPEPLTAAERRWIRQLMEDLAWEQNVVDGADQMVQVSGPDGADPVTPARVRLVSFGLALALVAAVVAIGLALAAKDSEDERQVLSAVGAPPRVLRRVATLRAALLVGAAAVVAVPTGLLPAAAIVEAATSPGSGTSLRVDAPALLFVLVAVPVLVGALVSVAAAARDRLRPPRADVFAFGE